MAKTKAKGFHWGTVKVCEESGEKFTLKALIYGSTGLCISQYDPIKPEGKFISVTHINSGKRLVNAFNEAQTAKQFCEAVSGLIDWNKLVDDRDGSLNAHYPGLGKKIRDLRALVVEHRENWKKALVAKILIDGGLEE